ncbi:type II secretion system protein [Candidatus Pelagibacter sp.]|nr:type II secretion system protein [Candidatus Pelagibacter sp.]
MKIKKNAFTILELLVVLAIIGVFSGIAYPNISKWIQDRAVKKEVYDVIAYINERKSEVQSGKYGMVQVALNTRIHTYIMTTQDYIYVYNSFDNKGGLDDYYKQNKVCRYQQRYTKQDTSKIPNLEIGSRNNDSNVHVYPSTDHPSPKHFSLICITKDGTIRHENNNPKNVSVRDPSTGKYHDYFLFCSKSSKTIWSARDCKENAKHEIMYRIIWDQFVNIKVEKYNKTKNKWIKIDG